MKKIRVLFVCLGNICRSPTGEAVLNTLIKKENLVERIECDSAGISDVHHGDESDPRTISHAKKRGHDVTSYSRPITPPDLENFDYILAMDNDNYRDIMKLENSKKFSQKVFKMVQFCTTHKVKEVPDPYYGGDEGFQLVIDILEDACKGFLEKVRTDHHF